MSINNDNMTDFELQIMQMMLVGDDPVLAILREQYASASVVAKDYTGHGFFINYTIPEHVERLHGKQDVVFGDVQATISSSQDVLLFILFIRVGVISFLEGCTTDHEWPENLDEYQLSYIFGNRDMDNLRKEWSDNI